MTGPGALINNTLFYDFVKLSLRMPKEMLSQVGGYSMKEKVFLNLKPQGSGS